MALLLIIMVFLSTYRQALRYVMPKLLLAIHVYHSASSFVTYNTYRF